MSEETKFKELLSLAPKKGRSCRHWAERRGFISGGERYLFDFDLCSHEYGWEQLDTKQDAWYFGVWYHTRRRVIVSFAEGDLIVIGHKTIDSFDRHVERYTSYR